MGRGMGKGRGVKGRKSEDREGKGGKVYKRMEMNRGKGWECHALQFYCILARVKAVRVHLCRVAA